MVHAAVVADEVVSIFERLFELAFPIERMQRIDHFHGSDDASMAGQQQFSLSTFGASRAPRRCPTTRSDSPSI